jgi:sporulation protein YtfJ
MENSVGGILGSAMDSIMKTMGDNCTIGTPIETKNGTLVIPVSKISVGFAGGGSDFGKSEKENKNFGGGGGTGITAKPVGFLVVTPEGKVTFTSVEGGGDNNSLSVDTLIENVGEIINKIKDQFPKKKQDKTDKPVLEDQENHE